MSKATDIQTLARMLACNSKRQDRADSSAMDTNDCSEKQGFHRQAATACDAVFALENAISCIRGTDLTDAAIQLAVAHGFVGVVLDSEMPRLRQDEFLSAATRAIWSALALIVRETGIDVNQYGVERYVYLDHDPFPQEDTA